MNQQTLRSALRALSVMPLALPALALAQPQLEEVVVTAERRAQSIQDVPLSVAALAGSDIEVGKISGLNDIAFRTPGLTYNQFSIGEPRIYIRGIGNSSDSAGSDPAVGVFLDEVYIGRTGGVGFDLFDLERVEILRGPQGTLYGKNTNGGAINIVTSRPSQESEVRLRVSAGTDELRHFQALATGGLSERIAGKLVYSFRDRDGYGRNVISPGEINTAGNFSNSPLIGGSIGAGNAGEKMDDARAVSARGQLMFEITEDVDLLLSADYAKDETNGPCRHIQNVDSAIAGLAPFWRIGMSKRYMADDRNCASQFDTSQERTVEGLMARLEVDLEWSTLTSITAWRASEYDWVDDLTGIPLNDLDAPSPAGVPLPPGFFTAPGNVVNGAEEDASQFSQEFRLAGDSDRFNWLAGAFFMEEDVERAEEFYTQYSTPLQGLGLAAVGDVLFTQDNTTTSYALYGQVDWNLTDQLTLTYGVRWAEDEKEITQNAIDLLGTAPSGVPLILPSFPAPVSAEDSWSEITHKLSLAWRPSDDLMFYATYAEGFKSGAFQSQTNLPGVAGEPVDPEIVENIELGMKSSWWNRRLQFNLSYYDMSYDDLQVFELNSRFLLVLLNAQAESRGVEASIDVVPVENFTLSASYNWSDATFEEFINANGLDLSDRDLPFAPDGALTATANYRVPLDGGSALDFGLSYSWKDEYYTGPQNRPVERQGSVELIDASVSWTSADGSLAVDVWGKNLNDELQVTNRIVDPTGVTSEYYMPPRTAGVTLTKSF
jgi:iron complex outermembrane receptor protein